MREYIKKLNKYVILLIISSLFGMPWWLYMKFLIFKYGDLNSIVESIPVIVDYLIKLTVIVLLIIDFKKDHLKNIALSVIAAFLYPLLGIVIYFLLLIEKERTSS